MGRGDLRSCRNHREGALRDCIFDVGFGEDPTLANTAFSADAVERIRSGKLEPSAAIALGLFDPDDAQIEAELATGPLEDAADRLLWTFGDDTTAPDTTAPDSVEVTEIWPSTSTTRRETCSADVRCHVTSSEAA